MRALLPLLLLLASLSGIGAAASNESVTLAQKTAVKDYLDALAEGGAGGIAYAVHPSELQALRERLLGLMRDESRRGESTVRSRLFGTALPLADIERLTSVNFYTTLARRLSQSGRRFASESWIAAVPGRGDEVHILFRARQPKDHGDVEIVQVVTLKSYGRDWKAAIPDELLAQIDDLLRARQPELPAARASSAPLPGSVTGAALPGIKALLGAAERALTEGKCDVYYKQSMSPNFRRVIASKALDTLIESCTKRIGNRELLISTLRIVQSLEPRLEYQGQRAIYDLSGQGLPFDRFTLEQVEKRWYIAE